MVKYRIITNTEIGKKEYIIDDFLDFDDLLDIIYDIKSKDYKNEQIIINQKVEYKHQNIDRIVNFSHCIFEKDVFFIYVTFKKGVLFTNTIFNGIANFNQSIFLGEHCNFVKAKFNNQTHFERTKFHSNNTSFGKTEFNNKTFFIKADFHNKVSIGATFTDNVHFNEAKFLGDNINFNGSTFNKKVRFHHYKFHHWVKFKNTTFKDLVDFYDATFEREQQFYRVDFENVSIFSNTKFRGETQFLYCTTDPDKTYLNFESAEFDKYVDISRCNFNNNLNFWNVKISENLDLSNTKYYKDSFGIHKNDTPNAHTLIRESYRRIKKSFADNGNKIAESEFAGREQKIFLKELWKDDSNEENFLFMFIPYIIIMSLIYYVVIFMFQSYPIWLFIYSIIHIILILMPIIFSNITINITRHFNNFIMLLLNRFSNNFGRSWIQGIIFTLVISIAVFILLVLNSKYCPSDNFILDFIKVVNIIDIKPFSDDDKQSPFTKREIIFYIILFIGRIFIGYGYYQTIQAFRKYGKS